MLMRTLLTRLSTLGMLLAAWTLAPHAWAAEEIVISDDGRQILLKGDGTWVQLSRDRFATNEAGQRIRLRPDGRWAVVTDADAPPSVSTPAAPLAPLAAASEPVLHLSDVAIVRKVVERAKSKHAEVRMHYVLRVENATATELRLSNERLALIRAASNRGDGYKVLSVDANTLTVAPGESAQVDVWTSEAPRWWGTKYLSLEIPPGVFANSVRRIVSKQMNEVRRIEVENFDS